MVMAKLHDRNFISFTILWFFFEWISRHSIFIILITAIFLKRNSKTNRKIIWCSVYLLRHCDHGVASLRNRRIFLPELTITLAARYINLGLWSFRLWNFYKKSRWILFWISLLRIIIAVTLVLWDFILV